MARREIKHDGRKMYPSGTRGGVTIEAETDEPQTKARGQLFAKIVGDTMMEARATVEQRLRDTGFSDLHVWIDMGTTSIDYWFDGTFAIDVYEYRNSEAS